MLTFQALQVVAEPEQEPILLDEAKNHVKVDEDTTEDDELIEGLITAARQHVEDVTRRALITQTFDLRLECWPRGRFIELPRPPLQSIESISYTLEDGTVSTLDAADYLVDPKSEPGRLLLQSSASWPSDALQPGASVAVRFVAGYGDDGDDVPRTLRTAMLLLIGHWYEHREAVIDLGRATLVPVPMAVDSLLWPQRMWDGFL